MSVFGSYARFYGLLYRDKDYGGEARFVHELIQRHAPGAHTLLELGCGTGAHACHFARIGYELHGIDRSDEMLRSAAARRGELAPAIAARLRFSWGDLTTTRLDKRFDAVIALFHVMSYQTANADLSAAFATVGEHLNTGGVLVFDCWYGPGVLTDRPAVRVKRLEDDTMALLRVAEPEIEPNENRVTVRYEMHITDKVKVKTERLSETHSMRYLFKPEVEAMLDAAGLELVETVAWMEGGPPGLDTWCACFVGRKR